MGACSRNPAWAPDIYRIRESQPTGVEQPTGACQHPIIIRGVAPPEAIGSAAYPESARAVRRCPATLLTGCASIVNGPTTRFASRPVRDGTEVTDMDCKFENEYGSLNVRTRRRPGARSSRICHRLHQAGVDSAKGVAISRTGATACSATSSSAAASAPSSTYKGHGSYPQWIRLVVGRMLSFDRSQDKGCRCRPRPVRAARLDTPRELRPPRRIPVALRLTAALAPRAPGRMCRPGGNRQRRSISKRRLAAAGEDGRDCRRPRMTGARSRLRARTMVSGVSRTTGLSRRRCGELEIAPGLRIAISGTLLHNEINTGGFRTADRDHWSSSWCAARRPGATRPAAPPPNGPDSFAGAVTHSRRREQLPHPRAIALPSTPISAALNEGT